MTNEDEIELEDAMRELSMETISHDKEIKIEVYEKGHHGAIDDCDNVIIVNESMSTVGQFLADQIQKRRTGEPCHKFQTFTQRGTTQFYITHA